MFQQKEQSHLTKEFYLPEQKSLLDAHIQEKRLIFKEAFNNQNINELCKVMESKHSIYNSNHAVLPTKENFLSLDWLTDSNLYYFMLSYEQMNQEFETKLIVYLARLYVLLSDSKWQSDRVLQDVSTVNINYILLAMNQLINFFKNDPTGAPSNFLTNMTMFCDHAHQLQLLNYEQPAECLVVENKQSSTEYEKESEVISPLASLHSICDEKSSFGIKDDIDEGQKPVLGALSSPLLTFLRSSAITSSSEGTKSSSPSLQRRDNKMKDLNEQKQELKSFLLDYLGTVSQRASSNMYYTYIGCTDETKKQKAQELLQEIDSAENLEAIQDKVENVLQTVNQGSGYIFSRSNNSMLVSKIRMIKEKINEFQLLQAGVDSTQESEAVSLTSKGPLSQASFAYS